jgi:hypothetical protein
VQNSKEANAYMWSLGGHDNLIQYNRMHCRKLTGKTPSELKEWAKKTKGLTPGQCSSGKEVLRHLAPGLACRMSLDDEFVKHGMALTDAIELTAGTERVYAKMIEMGMKPAELNR